MPWKCSGKCSIWSARTEKVSGCVSTPHVCQKLKWCQLNRVNWAQLSDVRSWKTVLAQSRKHGSGCSKPQQMYFHTDIFFQLQGCISGSPTPLISGGLGLYYSALSNPINPLWNLKMCFKNKYLCTIWPVNAIQVFPLQFCNNNPRVTKRHLKITCLRSWKHVSGIPRRARHRKLRVLRGENVTPLSARFNELCRVARGKSAVGSSDNERHSAASPSPHAHRGNETM